MICISILCFGHIANKFNDIVSILKEVIIFQRKVTYFVSAWITLSMVSAKHIRITYGQNAIFSFVKIPFEGKKLAVC